MMSVALTNEGPVTFILDSRSETPEPSLTGSSLRQGGSHSGTSTPGGSAKESTSTMTASQRAAEKTLRKAAWEAAKKEKVKTDAPLTADSNPSRDSGDAAH